MGTQRSKNLVELFREKIDAVLNLFRGFKHADTKSSDTLSKQRKLSKIFIHSTKAKGFTAFAIVAILLISVFAFLPQTQNQTNADQDNDDPTASPSPTLQETPNITPKKTQTVTPTPMWSPDRNPDPIIPIYYPEVEYVPKNPGPIESSEYVNSTVWKKIAENAWKYFQPGIGVDSTTGLPGAGLGWPYFTDWDLGVYIQAVIDAEKIGLIGKDGDWGSLARLDKVLKFLENRKLNETTGYPFWFYRSGNGENFAEKSDYALYPIDAVDSGKLLVGLANLKAYNREWETRINNFVLNTFRNRTNYVDLVPSVKAESLGTTSIYAYYVTCGFASFFPELVSAPETILNNIDKAGTVTTHGNITLPKAEILSEPLLHAIFELKNNSRIWKLSRNVYLAHEARFNETGVYVAFSEGNGGDHGVFIYEWVVLPNGETWKVTTIDRADFPINPIIYTKVALSFLALYNTTYARNLSIYLEQVLNEPTSGYNDGADFTVEIAGRTVTPQIGSNTNGLILSASRFALQR